MIDWNRISVLRDEVGADDFDEVVELFLDEVEEVIERLRNANGSADLEAELHFLKGSAMSLGFRAFSSLCQEGESSSAAGRADTVDVPAILVCYETSRELFVSKLPTAFAS